MTLAATALSIRVDAMRQSAAALQTELDTERRAHNALRGVLFSRLTSPLSVQGVSWPTAQPEQAKTSGKSGFDSLDDFLSGAPPQSVGHAPAGFLRMDGTVLSGGGLLRFMVQDHGGLIGIQDISQLEILERLATQGNRDAIDAPTLRDTLYDYQDSDDLRRLRGAESHLYKQSGLPPPNNGALRTPWELRAVIGWNELLHARPDSWILRVFKEYGSDQVNANSAPPEVLELILRTPQDASKFVERRESSAWTSIYDVAPYLDPTINNYMNILPTGGLRMWWWQEGDTVANVYDVQFDPMAAESNVWHFNWTRKVTLPDELAQSPANVVSHPFFD